MVKGEGSWVGDRDTCCRVINQRICSLFAESVGESRKPSKTEKQGTSNPLHHSLIFILRVCILSYNQGDTCNRNTR